MIRKVVAVALPTDLYLALRAESARQDTDMGRLLFRFAERQLRGLPRVHLPEWPPAEEAEGAD